MPAHLDEIMWEKTHVVAPEPFSGPMKAKGKAYVCFPTRRLYCLEVALQAISSTPRLTLAMPAAIAFTTAFFVDHRVTAALRTEVTGNAQVAQAKG